MDTWVIEPTTREVLRVEQKHRLLYQHIRSDICGKHGPDLKTKRDLTTQTRSENEEVREVRMYIN
jgi:hypothetical protein